jgi:hypothetical protein
MAFPSSLPSDIKMQEEDTPNTYQGSVAEALWLLGHWEPLIEHLTSSARANKRSHVLEAALIATSCWQRAEAHYSALNRDVISTNWRTRDNSYRLLLSSAYLSLAKVAALSGMDSASERFVHDASELALMAFDQKYSTQVSPPQFFQSDKTLADCRERKLKQISERTEHTLRRYASSLRSALSGAAQKAPSFDAYNLSSQDDQEWDDRSIWAVLMLRLHCLSAAPLTIADCGGGSCRIFPLLDSLQCQYTYDAYDLLPQCSRVHQLDISEESLPNTYSAALLLGVIEYLPDVERALTLLGNTCRFLVLSHVYKGSSVVYSNQRLEELSWITHLTVKDLHLILRNSGFAVIDERVISYNTVLLTAQSDRFHEDTATIT